ncbi:polysaccharide pyruvyl transferase family protein [Methanothermobacter sp. K4]|uniref:polysaccharide pyruvyl transferase family protein n=1 Tax=Methanothermobacter sp. K4 TaxID=2913262 RepID=UPI00351D54CE
MTIEGINDDRVINRKVFDKVKNKEKVFNLEADYNSEELKYVISNCDLFLGARMHANIAALSSCVPAIAISYSIKTPGLMKLCGLENYYIDFKDLSEEALMEKISDAWENRKEITEHLKRRIPEIKKRAMRNGELVKELCDSLGLT